MGILKRRRELMALDALPYIHALFSSAPTPTRIWSTLELHLVAVNVSERTLRVHPTPEKLSPVLPAVNGPSRLVDIC